TGTHHHAIFQGGMTFAFIPGGTAQGHAVIKRNIITNFSSFTNYHAHAMVDKETATNFCTWVNFNTCGKTAKRRQQASRAFTLFLPKFMSNTMHNQCMYARISRESF